MTYEVFLQNNNVLPNIVNKSDSKYDSVVTTTTTNDNNNKQDQNGQHEIEISPYQISHNNNSEYYDYSI